MRFIRSTWPLVHGWLGFASRCSIPLDHCPRTNGGQSLAFADHIEAHLPGRSCVSVAGLISELNAVICENGVDLVRRGFEHVLKELPSRAPVGLFNELGHSELAGAVDTDEQI